jgi:uncharacterized membrane-anchored protein YjiN (DUF445 family)
MTPYDPDAAARRALARHRTIATALLLLMAALTLASYALPPSTPANLFQAAAKAGFIGGIADWFAVVALFRHPLGLPIPHTAILPAQKERLGRALGRFVAGHVFTQDQVAAALTRIDLPGILRRFLADPAAARPAAQALGALLPRLLGSLEDGRARRTLARIIPRIVGSADGGRVVGRALRGLVSGGQHHEVLTFVLAELKTTLAAKQDQLHAAIEQRVTEHGGKLVGWAVGASIANRVLIAVNQELDRIGPDSALREAFDEWVNREIARIEEDPVRAAEIGRAIRGVVAHETVQTWLGDVWTRARRALEADAARPSGRTVALIEGAFGNLGTMLAADPAARAALQRGAEQVVARLMPAAQAQLADFIASVIAGWDTATLTDRLELRVGKDLQYVRVNGTLVGFLVGGLVYAVLHATFGYSF